MSNYGYYVFGRDMNNLNLKILQGNGVTDLFLNFYAISLYGESKVKKFIESCKEHNIKVHLWVQSFYNDGGWINPKTANLKNKLNEIKKYTRLNGLTGIHLDYLRYPGNAYKTTGGADAITDFVRNVKKSLPKGMVLSCAVMPEKEGKKYYGQDIEKLGDIVDFVVPMQYKGNYNASSSWLKDTTKYFSKYATVWSGLQSYKSDDNPKVLSSSELLGDVKTCIGSGANGSVLFRYGLSPKDFKFETISSKVSKKDNFVIDKVTVKKISTKIKEYVETNKKFASTWNVNGVEYSYGELAYILSYYVNNPNKTLNYTKNSIKNNSKSVNSDKFKGNILEDDFKDISKRVYDFCKKNKSCPVYASTIGGKKLKPRDFLYMMARVLVYYYNHNNTYPKYAVVDNKIWK